MAGQPGQYRRDRTAGTCEAGQVGLKSQAEHVRLDRQRGQDGQNMPARTVHPGQDSQDRTAGTGQIEHDRT